jgi:hypothetical protein
MEKSLREKLLGKFMVFSLIGIFFYSVTPNAGYAMYITLIATALAWLFYEWNFHGKPVIPALSLGVFLVVFDWIIENAGGILGFWYTKHSIFTVGYVPIEIMVLILVGGTAWAMHLPARLNKKFVYLECLLFGLFGAFGEWLFQLNDLMVYGNGWTSIHAFFGYAIVWFILFWVWYTVINKRKKTISKGVRRGKRR